MEVQCGAAAMGLQCVVLLVMRVGGARKRRRREEALKEAVEKKDRELLALSQQLTDLNCLLEANGKEEEAQEGQKREMGEWRVRCEAAERERDEMQQQMREMEQQLQNTSINRR